MKQFNRHFFFIVTLLLSLCTNEAWGQDATFSMGVMALSMYSSDGNTTLTFAGGGTSDVHTDTGITDLSQNAYMTLARDGGFRYIRITMGNDNTTYSLKWGGNSSATTSIKVKGSIILVSNHGANNIKILNESSISAPIKKVEVFYQYDGFCTNTSEHTEANATKTVSGITCINNTIPLDKINVIGQYCSFSSTNGHGIMMNTSGDHYLSIKFESAVDLHELSSFVIDGTNVTKSDNSGVFYRAQFICGSGSFDKYNNPACANNFETNQSTLLKETKEIRLYNDTREGVFTIKSITLNFNSTHATPSNPTLNNGTKSDMMIFEGESLTLSATNGYWREFTDNTYTTEKNQANGSPIPDNRWDPSAPFDGMTLSKLGIGDHYFGIQDATTCNTFRVRHSSGLIKVHVAVLSGMNPIYQPVYGQSFDGIAKEYLPIADITIGNNTISDNLKVDGNAVTSLPSTLVKSSSWSSDKQATITGKTLFSLARSGKDGENTDIKSNNAFILCGDGESYTIDQTKGINISQNGRAMMPEYLNGTQGSFPTHGVIAIKLQGTLDFTLLTSSKYDTDVNRRTLKIYYTNDQLDGELKELKECWFYGTRCEGYNNYLAPLSASIRLPQLGKDGTCTVFITYEGNGKDSNFTHAESDNDEMWIKGFVIKRPDLKVTIGRTDTKYSGQTYDGENNTTCTHFGEDKPYIWSFENVGFNNTKSTDLNSVKVNQKDGRTYISGGTDDDVDHLLVFSDIASDNDNDKVHFNGITAGQEYIEFRNASKYNIPTEQNNRKIWNPITSNGLKVNVTGSGWFKIKCSAPNGPVNMKVYSSTNYGTTYINLLREFTVAKTSSATDWQEYTVYLKGHVDRDGDNGFWDGNITGYGNTTNAEEIIRMSLYVVYDAVGGTSYTDSHPQLNIHQLSWLNEVPADYVFQREEDPKLLTDWQSIKRNNETVLYWRAGTELKEKKDNVSIDTYKSNGQFTRTIGSKSPDGYASTSVPSDAGTYNAYWDIAAPATTNAHTEKAYANQGFDFTSEKEYQYVDNGNTEFDMPISGSFIRICAMKNAYVVAHVLPGAAGGEVYVLDESGSPIPYKANGSDLDVDANKRGYVSTFQNFDGQEAGGAKSIDGTMRIDFTANAGKEYFICAKGASISLARLEVQAGSYNPTKSSTTLELTDNGNNSEAITTAINTETYYSDAKLTRILTAGMWASIVLPFSMNEKKFQEVFGDDAKCVHFTGVNTTTNTVNLTHHFYNMIVAGRPVFIRPSKNVTDPTITDITLQASTVKTTKTANDFEFFASYDNATMSKNDLYLNNNNAIKYLSVASATYPGMRSFIKSPDGYDPSIDGTGASKALFLNFDGEEIEEDATTGIQECIAEEFGENVVVISKSTKVYDLNGRIVGNGADINRLPAGMYIVNGKKYFVK